MKSFWCVSEIHINTVLITWFIRTFLKRNMTGHHKTSLTCAKLCPLVRNYSQKDTTGETFYNFVLNVYYFYTYWVTLFIHISKDPEWNVLYIYGKWNVIYKNIIHIYNYVDSTGDDVPCHKYLCLHSCLLYRDLHSIKLRYVWNTPANNWQYNS